MVKQRFLTPFKPWLFAVIKVGGLIVGYQLFDRIRTYFQYAPLNTMDVVTADFMTVDHIDAGERTTKGTPL